MGRSSQLNQARPSGAGEGSASVDFFDPTFATSLAFAGLGLSPTGFVVDGDGNALTRDVQPLDPSRLRSANVPVPGTLALLGLGAICSAWRRRGR